MQLGFEDQSYPEYEDGAEPEDLARVLEASNVGPLAIGQMEAELARRGEELPTSRRQRCFAVRSLTTIVES